MEKFGDLVENEILTKAILEEIPEDM